MKHNFRDIGRDDKFDKDQHIGLWNKYVTHIYSSKETLANIANLTSIQQYLLNLIDYRFHVFLSSMIIYIDFYSAKVGCDDEDITDFLIERVSKPRYDNTFMEILIRDDLQRKFNPNIKLLNNFITELLLKREINTYIIPEDLKKFSELNKVSDFNSVVEKLNLFIQDRKHSNLIVEIVDLYFKGELSSFQSWDKLSEEVKERITGENKAGRNPYEEYPQEKIEKHVRNRINDVDYIWDTPKKQGQIKIAKIAMELLDDVFVNVDKPMTYEAMIIRVNNAIRDIEKN